MLRILAIPPSRPAPSRNTLGLPINSQLPFGVGEREVEVVALALDRENVSRLLDSRSHQFALDTSEIDPLIARLVFNGRPQFALRAPRGWETVRAVAPQAEAHLGGGDYPLNDLFERDTAESVESRVAAERSPSRIGGHRSPVGSLQPSS